MKNWLSGRKRPASPEHVKRTAVGLAHELGLFSDDELATRNDAGLLALVSDRVGQARRFIVFATALVLLINGGSRPPARAMPKNVAVAIGTIYKWADIDRAPRAISESNAFLNRLAIFARAELQKRRVRIAAERGAPVIEGLSLLTC